MTNIESLIESIKSRISNKDVEIREARNHLSALQAQRNVLRDVLDDAEKFRTKFTQ